MNNDNNPQNQTVLVPRPGAASVQSTVVPAAASPGGVAQQYKAPTYTPGVSASDTTAPTSLTTSALTLLALMASLQNTAKHDNVPNLHKHITQEIKQFENSAVGLGVTKETVLAARYLMCSAMDEIVLNTPWGAQSGWSQHSLLSLFHKETSGGEKTFAILDKMLAAPGQNLEVLELFFHCFSLGFMGKFRFNPRGSAELEQIQDNLYATLKGLTPGIETDLSPHWQAHGNNKPSLVSHIPLWVIGCVTLALLVISFSGFRYWLYQSSEPVTELIESRITTTASQAPSAKDSINRD